jgi:ATP-dependent Clp protease adaptor protein ClpS
MENEKKNDGGGSAVATRKKAKAASNKPKPAQMPPFNVVLLNDDDHTYDYVVEMLKVIFGFPQEKGYLLAEEVDSEGTRHCHDHASRTC